ncbi:ExbD/TolR family protein [Pseudoteredinibacter isoporae]|uniref:Biopolymer transport protein ExbD n=1 Tax=Pseudoteredinibacter isoporae TaxID=570281 RepID=A0A7X0MUW6_9GAMM|nr:biopolymer transporter ExbD [Pseudoteredinibacter isoporae]MBB6520455.1 biopolymer transport protein ExbD [Pseudoteredinibacter isoporae]NHO86022.1 biopolymer transporter ExbD [Pseudoteredinibacter isoporae]NIB25527.1 biopolymer transporter ExbD [Pseudoteredinibacter isoporae]
MAKKRKVEEEGGIDLTPMLDVVFIMLIFFIVTASFIKETGIEINRPDATTAEPKYKSNILIAINGNNEIWIDKSRIDERQVRNRIEQLRAENPKGGIVVQADDKASIETLTKVVDAARDLGVTDVAVATEKN